VAGSNRRGPPVLAPQKLRRTPLRLRYKHFEKREHHTGSVFEVLAHQPHLAFAKAKPTLQHSSEGVVGGWRRSDQSRSQTRYEMMVRMLHATSKVPHPHPFKWKPKSKEHGTNIVVRLRRRSVPVEARPRQSGKWGLVPWWPARLWSRCCFDFPCWGAGVELLLITIAFRAP
jgi:hypothetical protein